MNAPARDTDWMALLAAREGAPPAGLHAPLFGPLLAPPTAADGCRVVGRLAQGKDAIDALMAGFPAGTVSGAPKVRAMEIIDELEKHKRGPYAGCVGYFSADGQMDTCIVLRTALIKDGVMHVQAGAGIVYDSIPENEQQECINKAKALVRAAEEAVSLATRSKRQAPAGNGGMFG